MSSAVVQQDWAPPDPRPVTPSTILARELGEICTQLDSAPDVDPEVVARLRRALVLAQGLDPYLGQCTSPESPALAELAQRTHETNWDATSSGPVRLEQEMLSGHVEGQLLKFLVHLANAQRVLEIGMFTGYSALAMAEALPEDGVVVACEVDPEVARFAQECFEASPAGRRITVEVGPALETLQRLSTASAEQFEFVFVDADKSGYLDYVEFLLGSALLSPRAVIASTRATTSSSSTSKYRRTSRRRSAARASGSTAGARRPAPSAAR